MKKWLVINQQSGVIVDTDDLEYAWSVGECASVCGQNLTVIKNPRKE